MTNAVEDADDYKRAMFDKINGSLRKDGFTEIEIARINTAIRRALNFE